MTAVARVSVEAREVLAQRMARTTAPHLAVAVRQGDAALIEELLTPLTMQDLYTLAVVLAEQAPTPRRRPEDGEFDEIAVQRAAGGDVVPLTQAERAAAIRLMGRRGIGRDRIAKQFRMGEQTVRKILTDPAPEQTDLLREVP